MVPRRDVGPGRVSEANSAMGWPPALRGLLLGCALGGAIGHGAMTQPPSRNAVDGAVHPWNGR
eukprot:COSAG01_NODE_67_length_29188_cov_1135.609474_31_plen_63_part_00